LKRTAQDREAAGTGTFSRSREKVARVTVYQNEKEKIFSTAVKKSA